MTATDVTGDEPPVAEPPPVTADERISHRARCSVGSISPEIGALIGAIIVWAFFWGNGQTFGEADTTLNWLDVAAPTGIMAAAVALLMIGGEFDLSSGVMTGATAIQIGLVSRYFMGDGVNIGWAIASAFLAAAAIGWFNGYDGQQDRAAQLHRHPRHVLHASRRDAGDLQTSRRQGAGRPDHQAGGRRLLQELDRPRVEVHRVRQPRQRCSSGWSSPARRRSSTACSSSRSSGVLALDIGACWSALVGVVGAAVGFVGLLERPTASSQRRCSA